jgi:hypothetical protein
VGGRSRPATFLREPPHPAGSAGVAELRVRVRPLPPHPRLTAWAGSWDQSLSLEVAETR